jgi:predicted PurR-regulated permease PerM
MEQQTRTERAIAVAALAALAAGCVLVLKPFASAILWAVVLTYSTWPVYQRIRKWLGGRAGWAALAMTSLLVLVVLLPITLVVASLADNAAPMAEALETLLKQGPPEPPDWVAGIPLIGQRLQAYWQSFTHDSAGMMTEFARLFEPMKSWLVSGGLKLGEGVLSMALSIVIGFFLYRDGDAASLALDRALRHISGERAQRLKEVAGNTVRGVVYGVLGTALAQALVAWIGLFIAGVPGSLLWAVLTFFLSIVPVGPPVVWISATVWLATQGSTGWAVFMALWGFFAISGVDNVVKPYLISRGSSLPFILVLLGVLGGVITFGLIGLFIGPTLLAVGYRILQEWIVGEAKVASPIAPAD